MGNIYLTGMMGCGKSAVGRAVAQKTKRKFFDIDACIERDEEKEISRIFEEQGESVFRRMETDMLRRIVQSEDNAIVSCGGGIVLADENIRLMCESGVIVYIERDIEEIAGQVDIKNRPVLKDDKSNIEKVFKERRARYESTCHYRICNDKEIGDAADSLITLLQL